MTDFSEINMKPLLGKLVQRAVVLAIIDSIPPLEMAEASGIDEWVRRQDERAANLSRDIYSVTDDEWSGIDPIALAKNVACRLLGHDGWAIGSVYSGNATVQQVVNACFGAEQHRDPLADIVEALGLEESDSLSTEAVTATPGTGPDDRG